MTIFLDRVDAAPILEDDFSFAFRAWLAVMVDSLNETINSVQNAFNLLQAPQYTTTQINALFVAGELVNGMILYDSVLNVYVGIISGALVKFTTTAYP